MTYIDKEIAKCLKRIQDLNRSKKINYDKIRINLYKLTNASFKEGVYAGKTNKS